MLTTLSALSQAILFSHLASATLNFSPQNHSQEVWSWNCHVSNDSGISISYANGEILSETIYQYHVMEKGILLPESEIGLAVYNVKVDQLKHLADGSIQLETSLQDYSDTESWSVSLLFRNGCASALVQAKLQSSDGDENLHTSLRVYPCRVSKKLIRF